jgi:hypothetical protein
LFLETDKSNPFTFVPNVDFVRGATNGYSSRYSRAGFFLI